MGKAAASNTATAANLQGYAGSGLSQYTRRHARDATPHFELSRARLSAHGLILKETNKMRALAAKYSVESDPARRDKLLRSLEIKQKFVARLQAQIDWRG